MKAPIQEPEGIKRRKQIFTPGALPRLSRERPTHCIVENCGKPVRSRGLCNSHYHRWYTQGDVHASRKRRPAPNFDWLVRAMATETDECILSPFQRSKDGYARFTVEGKLVFACRYICERFYGPPPTPKHHSAHSCGRGRDGCVNKRHLSWKTPKDNINDKREHGTMLFGDRHPMAKLSEAQVKEIKAKAGTISRKDLAALYGVKLPTIQDIMRGATWRHV